MLGFITAIFGVLAMLGMFLCLFLLIPVVGYFCVRLLLKVMGLHSASPEQFRNELKLVAMCGVLVFATIVCLFIMELFGWASGSID